MKAALFLNGAETIRRPDLVQFDVICAADGAYDFLRALDIVPDWIIGDMDSIEVIPSSIKFYHITDQDSTDFDKALDKLVEEGCKHVTVFNGSGNEQDHFLGNISTMLQYQGKIDILLSDSYGTFILRSSGDYSFVALPGTLISLIPIYEVSGITTEGLYYPLHNEDLRFGNRIGIRNRSVENNYKIRFTSGYLLIYQAHLP